MQIIDQCGQGSNSRKGKGTFRDREQKLLSTAIISKRSFVYIHVYCSGGSWWCLCSMSQSATCSFAKHSGKTCGSSSRFLKEVSCVGIEACGRNIYSHLKRVRLLRSGISTEKELILTRAGYFNQEKEGEWSALSVCPLHRDELGIYWKEKRPTECKHPLHIQNKWNWKPDRTVCPKVSRAIVQYWGVLVPVGSG